MTIWLPPAEGMSVNESLARIENGLRGLYRDRLLKALRPGIGPEVIRSQFERVGLPSSEALEALLAWHDGADDAGLVLGDLWLFDGFYVMSLDESIADYSAFVGDAHWSTGWFPFMADGGGYFFVIDFAAGGVIRRFRNDESQHPVEYGSLEAMLSTIAAGFERGTFFVSGDGYIDIDEAAYAALAAELNPGISWWTDPV